MWGKAGSGRELGQLRAPCSSCSSSSSRCHHARSLRAKESSIGPSWRGSAVTPIGAIPIFAVGPFPIRHAWGAMSLFTRVLLANAVVLAIATLLLLFSPIEISYPVTDTQAVILIAGFVASVILNMLLLREVIAPLRRLTATMRSIEPLQPGRRLAIRGTDTDVAALTEAFNDMLDRLGSERRESGRQALLAQEAERLDRAARGEATPTDPLTAREVEIVKLVAEGHTSDEIAAVLVIAKKTVEHHRSHILEKLGMRDRVELTRYAIRRGLVEP
jgi:DNA-binding CsgD family transcriptional regulator/multisubunit Na+/H+ antiporter MnhF subunit